MAVVPILGDKIRCSIPMFSCLPDLGVSSLFAESHFAESHFTECRVSFSFHHFYFKFLSLMRYKLFMGVNEMCVKILLLLPVRVSVTVMVSLV